MNKTNKKEVRKYIIIFILSFIILWIIIGLVLYLNNNKKSLQDIGYSYREIKLINKKVSKENKIYILKQNYNKYIINFISNDNYKDENLKKYIDYYKKYKVNPDIIITWVNDYNNLNLDFNENTLKLLKEDYFIFNNLDRYLSYQKKNKKKSYKEIIREVNSNIDKKFYIDIKPADIKKEKLILVNKFYYLDKDYKPDNLVNIESTYGRTSVKLNNEAYENFKKMFNEAKKKNLNLYIRSGYRSYNDQENMYNYYVKNDSIKEADRYSARPGYSEHQTGFAIDLIKDSAGNYNEFKNTEEFSWLKKNSYKYGFILRYTDNFEYITGYIYEPWHYRYVGIDVAKYIYEHKITYEEYYAYFVE